MKRVTARGTRLLVAAILAMFTTAQTTVAQTPFVSGTVRFHGEKAIPKGQIEIFLKDLEMDGANVVKTQLKSDGGSREIAFSLELPVNLKSSPSQQIVARLERADGWLLARGSAKFKIDTPVEIILNTVLY
ncbi:MAG: hypothetical protein K5905_00465 [Roseibium sp.]|uniref:hypothetical protein n=1 Tax=Roseibium sp. TaxID=1936156 RepID=UPI00262B6CDF|nr:hypothetical protein [Roseibium sp.]MCV0423921.1 hypothetical protein [Roseibium sp.]